MHFSKYANITVGSVIYTTYSRICVFLQISININTSLEFLEISWGKDIIKVYNYPNGEE